MNKRFPKFFLAFISLAVTAFVFLNTYEVVFNQDVVLANAVHRFGVQDQIGAIIRQFDLKPEAGREETNSDYKRLEYIQIPALTSNLYLEEKRIINGSWYVRPSMGHYVGLNKDDHGVTVDYLIYTTGSWQTFAEPNQIEIGMDVKLFHDGHAVSVFKVVEKKMLTMESTFVASKSKNRQIILIIDDPDNHVYYGFSLIPKD